jgi:hypothetical protein
MGGALGEGTDGRGMSGFASAAAATSGSGAFTTGRIVAGLASLAAESGAFWSPKLSLRLLGLSPTAGVFASSAALLAVESVGEEGFGS